MFNVCSKDVLTYICCNFTYVNVFFFIVMVQELRLKTIHRKSVIHKKNDTLPCFDITFYFSCADFSFSVTL